MSEAVKTVDSLKSKVGDNVDELVQYSRRNCLLLNGVRKFMLATQKFLKR